MPTTGTMDDALILPDPTVKQKTATFNTDLANFDGVKRTQAIAGVTVAAYQAAYLAAYVRGVITATPAITGGTLADGTYRAIIAANIPYGPNVASVGITTYGKFLATTEVTFTISGGGGAGSCPLSWAAVNGAVPASGVTYQVWVTVAGGGAGTEAYFFTTTSTSFTVTSVSTGGTSGTVPAAVMPAQWQLATDSTPVLPNERYLISIGGSAGTVCYGQKLGTVVNAAWTWTPGAVIYLHGSTPGALTQTTPTGNSVAYALALSATRIEILTGGSGGGIPSGALTSSVSGFKVSAFYSGAGAPSSSTLTAGTYGVGDHYWDTTNSLEYICSTGGSNSTSVWVGA